MTRDHNVDCGKIICNMNVEESGNIKFLGTMGNTDHVSRLIKVVLYLPGYLHDSENFIFLYANDIPGIKLEPCTDSTVGFA